MCGFSSDVIPVWHRQVFISLEWTTRGEPDCLVSVISQDFIHLKSLLIHLHVLFFSVCLSCAVITYGVSRDILINYRRKNWRYNCRVVHRLFYGYVDRSRGTQHSRGQGWGKWIKPGGLKSPFRRMSPRCPLHALCPEYRQPDRRVAHSSPENPNGSREKLLDSDF